MADMAGKTVLITGADSGIGNVAARELARMGAAVVTVCCDRVKAEAALREVRLLSGDGAVEWMLLDLLSQAAIPALERDFMAQGGAEGHYPLRRGGQTRAPLRAILSTKRVRQITALGDAPQHHRRAVGHDARTLKCRYCTLPRKSILPICTPP